MSYNALLFGLGVAAGLIGYTVSNVAFNIQKLSHYRNEVLPPEQSKAMILQKLWIIGMRHISWGCAKVTKIGLLILLVGNAFELVAFALAAQSVIAPLSVWSLVFSTNIRKES